jgi:hypothetical protein
MTKTISAGTCSAIVAAATISALAQTPPAPSQNPPPQTATTTSTEHRITVTGCLKPAPAAATDTVGAQPPPSTTGTAGTTVPPSVPSDAASARFVLSGATTSPAETDPATTPQTSKDSAHTYRLLANPAALSPLVGKKLELTGAVIDDATAQTLTTMDLGSPAAGPLLKVEAGKIVAATCQE